MIGIIIGIAIGVGAIILGAKGFSPAGLPLTGSKRITGNAAKIVGGICIFVGLIFIAGSVYPFIRAN
jgi:phosphate/sulfate permease